MGALFTILFVLTSSVLSFAMHVQAETLYLYEPQSALVTVRDGATWAEVEWAVATSNPEAFQPPTQPTRTVQAGRTRKDFCQQWIDLNLEIDGGLDMGSDETTRKWLALSRIVTATNLCEEYLARPVYPRIR